jgi:hypothetical protein
LTDRFSFADNPRDNRVGQYWVPGDRYEGPPSHHWNTFNVELQDSTLCFEHDHFKWFNCSPCAFQYGGAFVRHAMWFCAAATWRCSPGTDCVLFCSEGKPSGDSEDGVRGCLPSVSVTLAPVPMFHLLANLLGAICFGVPVGLLACLLTMIIFPLKRIFGSAASALDVWRAMVAAMGWPLDRLLVALFRLLWLLLHFPFMLVGEILSWIGGCLGLFCGGCVKWLRQ